MHHQHTASTTPQDEGFQASSGSDSPVMSLKTNCTNSSVPSLVCAEPSYSTLTSVNEDSSPKMENLQSQPRRRTCSMQEGPCTEVVAKARKFKQNMREANPARFMSSPPSSSGDAYHAPLDARIAQFDIFDSLDAERLREFDEMFHKVKSKSNYDAHTLKTKKHDPGKFISCAVVSADADGNRLIS